MKIRNGIDVMQQETPAMPAPMEQPLHMPRPVELETVEAESPAQENSRKL